MFHVFRPTPSQKLQRLSRWHLVRHEAKHSFQVLSGHFPVTFRSQVEGSLRVGGIRRSRPFCRRQGAVDRRVAPGSSFVGEAHSTATAGVSSGDPSPLASGEGSRRFLSFSSSSVFCLHSLSHKKKAMILGYSPVPQPTAGSYSRGESPPTRKRRDPTRQPRRLRLEFRPARPRPRWVHGHSAC